ncbi:unnamed protein product, partial [Mesorhabditis spiculigera]
MKWVVFLLAFFRAVLGEEVVLETPVYELRHQCNVEGKFHNTSELLADVPCMKLPKCSEGGVKHNGPHKMSFKLRLESLDEFRTPRLEISPTTEMLYNLIGSENRVEYVALPQSACFGCAYRNVTWTNSYRTKAQYNFFVPLTSKQRQRDMTRQLVPVLNSIPLHRSTEGQQGIRVWTFDPEAYKAPSLKQVLKLDCATVTTEFHAPILGKLEDRRIRPCGAACTRNETWDGRYEITFPFGMTKTFLKPKDATPGLTSCRPGHVQYTFPNAALRFSDKNHCEKGLVYQITWFGKGHVTISTSPTKNMLIYTILLLFHCAFLIAQNTTPAGPCVVNISTLNLEPKHYNGSWFVVARKAPVSKDYLPVDSSSSMMRLLLDDEGNLNMTEYHSINGTCMPPLSGFWRRHENAFQMEMRTENGQLIQLEVRAIFHELSGENNEEMNMVLYGCRTRESDGKCVAGEELISIMSNSRHPQTLQLFKSAKHIEDFACIDILLLNKMDTYNAAECGDEIVDEDQKLRHAKIWENDEYVDVECRAENMGQFAVPITEFFEEPRMLTVIAFKDPELEKEQISHVSCLYDSKTHAKCSWLRQRTCFQAELNQEFEEPSKIKSSSRFLKVNGTEVEIDLSGMVVWQNGDEYITMQCLQVAADGSCDQHRVYVWSDEDLMDQPTIREIYRALQNVCVDPTELIFLNTFHECDDQTAEPEKVPEITCGPQPNWSPLNTSLLQGVWYVAADLNADPKIFLQSAVIEFSSVKDNPAGLLIRYYAQKESDRECVGPGEGFARLLENGTLSVSIQYSYRQVPNYKNTMNFMLQILYLDNQRAVLYWCFRRAENGSCIQYDVDVLIRSRFFSYSDLSLIQPYLHRACVSNNRLRWFDLHSSCGYEMSASTKLRRDMVTLSHSEVLDILTNVQEPQCQTKQIRGRRAPLHLVEKPGTWFLMAQFDQMARDTYATIFRIHTVGEKFAIAKMHQSAAIPGEETLCFERLLIIEEVLGEDGDYSYVLSFDAANQASTTFIFRFLFFNRNVAVIYSCLNYKENGHCKENAIYVLSRHESIDHAELTVLEKVAKTVCINPDILFHTSTHDFCVQDHRRIFLPPQCAGIDAVPQSFRKLPEAEYSRLYDNIRLYAVASSRHFENPFSVIHLKGGVFTRNVQLADGNCKEEHVEILVSPTNRYLFLVHNVTYLVDPLARKDEILLKKAQLSGADLPCLFPMNYNDTTCDLATPPTCETSPPLSAAEGLLGDWMLYASDPFTVANSRCRVVDHPTVDGAHQFTCRSESWDGNCERVELFQFAVDAWGGYRLTSEVPAVHENFEIFPKGNVSLTADRLLFFREDPVAGRLWSVWIRTSPGATPDPLQTTPKDLGQFCVWPTRTQMRSLEQLC